MSEKHIMHLFPLICIFLRFSLTKQFVDVATIVDSSITISNPQTVHLWDTSESNSLFENKSQESMVQILYFLIFLAVDFYEPLKESSFKKFPLWFSSELKS